MKLEAKKNILAGVQVRDTHQHLHGRQHEARRGLE